MTISPWQRSEVNLQNFAADGFVAIDRLVNAEVVNTLRDYYDRILNKEIDCGQDDRMLGGLTRQVMHTRNHIPYFQDNPAIEAASEILSQHYGKPVVMNWDMLISKQAGNHNTTPWHQDFSYSVMPFAEAGTICPNDSVMVWLPLDDVGEENGCMHFLPGKHEGPMFEHYIFSGDAEDEGRLLASKQLEAYTDEAVACPIPAGGCTMHFNGTPHFTTGNFSTDRQRRAYIFNLSVVEEA